MQAGLHAFGQGQACVFSLRVLQRMLKDLTAAVLDLRGCEAFILSLTLLVCESVRSRWRNRDDTSCLSLTEVSNPISVPSTQTHTHTHTHTGAEYLITTVQKKMDLIYKE